MSVTLSHPARRGVPNGRYGHLAGDKGHEMQPEGSG